MLKFFTTLIDGATKKSFTNWWNIFIYVCYFKLPYIGNLSQHIKNRLSKLSKVFHKENFNIKLLLTSLKIKNYYKYKDSVPNDLKSFIVYTFTCASFSSSHIRRTSLHFKTRNEKHIKRIRSLIFSNICTPPQNALTRMILFLLKWLINLTLNST